MTRKAVSGLLPQYQKNAGGSSASGYWLKFYGLDSGSTAVPKSMFTKLTGGAELDKCKLNTRGETISNQSDDDSTFIPYVEGDYDAYLFLTESDADSNNTINATFLGANQAAAEIVSDAPKPEFQTVSDLKTGTATNYAQTVDFSQYFGRQVETLGFDAVNDGGGAVYVIESGTSGVNDADIIAVGANKAVRQPGQFKYSCGWIFDDGHVSQKDVAKPLFESKNAKFGFAVYTEKLDDPDRITTNDMIQLNRQGWEIISHSFSHARLDNSKTNAFVKAEVDTAWAIFESNGVNVESWLTPFSALGTNHINTIKERYSFAYTKLSNTEPMRDVDPHELRRLSIETFDTAQCREALENLVKFGGSIIFYAHDVQQDDEIYTRAENLLDYAQELGVPVKLPSESVKDGICGYKETGSIFYRGKTIYDRRANYTVSSGASITVDSNRDIRVEATAVGQVLIQVPLNVDLDIDSGPLNFSSSVRRLAGDLGPNNAIGLKVSTPNNSFAFYTSESDIGQLDTLYRRYNVSGQSFFGERRVLLFFRLDFTQVGEVALIRAPILRYGTDVGYPIRKEINDSYSFSPPTQTMSKRGFTTTNYISLTDQATNGLFSVSGDRIRFHRAATVSVSASLMSYGTNSLVDSHGGMMFLEYASGEYISAPVSTGIHSAGGVITTTINVDPEQAVRLSLFNVNADFTISSTHSHIIIREIRG